MSGSNGELKLASRLKLELDLKPESPFESGGERETRTSQAL